LPTSIVERFTRNGDGALAPWVEGKPLAEARTHAGITRVERYTFKITDAAATERRIR